MDNGAVISEEALLPGRMSQLALLAEMAFRRGFLLVCALLLETQLAAGCVCPAASVLSRFPSEIPAQVCCLNYSGSAFGRVRWSVFTNKTDLETLDLSSCNLSSVGLVGDEASALRRIYLGGNRLAALPPGFLSGRPSLLELDLSENLLQELPEDFLHGSDNLQELQLQGNRLRSLPESVLLKPGLRRLQLTGNPWHCSCPLVQNLQANRTAGPLDLLGNLTCLSPRALAGRTLWSVRPDDACRPAALTALFIALPLVILSALLLCWCCGRKRKKKDVSVLGASKKRPSGASCNGQKQLVPQLPPAAEQRRAGDAAREGILNNQLFLRPSSGLLGSTRDIYEEVEVKLGSAESLPRAPSRCSGPREPDGVGRAELDAVSVTEVMKDSADREKAYLTQSTEYYSLVPGIELEDSDHGEDSVDRPPRDHNARGSDSIPSFSCGT
ncbi:uncharacterized protein LOC115406035 isoform X2 [Salarias fasciatus]|uniref:uncharacterized protein LOC115406035 isoform X2 n=1 Tax=Salarias fasciatus TaxID=181472 RepID=UPI001176F33C|nr:uncharacterized protein LOC115406035 isoform X2 [Salarias fasciatus]